MKQEDKELLLLDLGCRIQSKVNLKVDGCRAECLHKLIGIVGRNVTVSNYELRDGKPFSLFIDHSSPIENIKPYLRPMSSMTEEEEREVMILWNEDFADKLYDKVSLYHCYPKTADFYNSHHFDYRGLIEKGLALEAPKDMYLTEKEKPAIPKTVEEAFPILDDVISDEDKKEYLKGILDEGEIEQKALSLHFSLGRWIRNNWGLWEEQENELKKLLSQKGFTHPDDMSNYIINEYIKYLNHTDY